MGKEDADSEEIPSGMKGVVYSSPCRNPFCDRYDKEKVQATSAPEGAPRKVTVKCPECSFAYDFDANCPRIYAIRNVGPRWEAHVRQMIAKGDRTKCQVAEAVGISPDTFDRVLARSNVATPDWAGPNKGVPWSDEVKQRQFEKRQQDCRAKFLEMRKSHPIFGRNALQQAIPNACDWLRKRDRAWYALHAPPKIKRLVRSYNYDWDAIDEEFAERVPQIVQELRVEPGFPKKITRAAIWTKLNPTIYARRPRERLPKTWAATDARESREEWHSRRCAWVADQYILEGVVPTLREFVERAALKNVRSARLFSDVDAYLRLIKLKVTS